MFYNFAVDKKVFIMEQMTAQMVSMKKLPLKNKFAHINIVSAEHITEFRKLLDVFDQCSPPGISLFSKCQHLFRFGNDPGFTVFLAKQNGLVIGGLVADVLQHHNSSKSSILIYNIGILTGWRCSGILKQLMAALINQASLVGLEEMEFAVCEE